ncbi:diguanylate cyclase [Roseivivax sp. CAU 1761]
MTGRILLIDAEEAGSRPLCALLSAACYDVTVTAGGAAALAALEARPVDLVLCAGELPDTCALRLCQAVSERYGAVAPRLMLLARNGRPERRAGLAAGAEEVFAPDTPERLVLARLRAALRARHAERELRLREGTSRALGFAEPQTGFERPPRVVILGEDSGARALRRALSSRLGSDLACLPRDAVLRRRVAPPEICVIRDEAEAEGGLDLLGALRACAGSRHAALLFLTARPGRAATALDLGADEVAEAAAGAAELALRLRRLARRKRHADGLRRALRVGVSAALLDPLTGLRNRRYGLSHLQRLAGDAAATGRRYAVILADIDRFKSVNDRCGHGAGDAVLCGVARRLAADLRASDLVSRIGGEEFLVTLPGADLAAAAATAERLRTGIRAAPITVGPGLSVPVTISLGVAAGPGCDATGSDILALADGALLTAKRQGRDRVRIAGAPRATLRGRARRSA